MPIVLLLSPHLEFDNVVDMSLNSSYGQTLVDHK